jgi:two-component system chemotaxis response regulator CheB
MERGDSGSPKNRHAGCKDIDVRRDVVVIGGSAGGVGALDALVRGLPGDFDAAVLVSLNTAERGPCLHPEILNRSSPIPARFSS